MKPPFDGDQLDFTLQVSSEQSRVVADLFRTTNDHFRNDINALWQRSQFFMAANIALLAFFHSAAFVRSDRPSVLAISIFGLIISLSWFMVAFLSVRWIDVWRHAVVNVENHLVAMGPFRVGESIGGRRIHHIWRPEICSYILAFVFGVFWLANLLKLIHYV